MFFFFFFNDQAKNSLITPRNFNDVKWENTANKGEWGELYTLYKLLADQNLFPIDNNQKSGERLRMPILSIQRFTDEDISAEYRIDNKGKVYINANGCSVIEVNRNEFEEISKSLLDAINKGAPKSSFEIKFLDNFRKLTCCPKIKCYSKKLDSGNKDKSDLYIVIHDALTGQTPKLGFSIKSEFGSSPTLLNASNLTNFKYKLSPNLPQEIINHINSMVNKKGQADIQGRVRTILNSGSSFKFCTIKPNNNGEYIFLENLILVDSSMPEILAHLLVMSYTEETRLLDELTDKLSIINPLHFPMRANKKYYEAKVKRFVTDVALGMLPKQPWDAAHQASGVLVATESGDIDCYHVIYKSTLENYLYHDLKFETPSVSRHGFGYIEIDNDGHQYFTLNLQLRFVK